MADENTTLPLSMLVNERHQHPAPSSVPPRGTGLWVGPFRGKRRGQGSDFDDLRGYAAGDEVRHVDWKVSARRGTMHTRLYREEKEQVMTFVADFRRTMFTGSKELSSVTAGRLLAALVWQAIDTGSRVSIMIVTDTDIQSTRPASGHKSAIAICGLLASSFAEARSVSLDAPSRTTKTLHSALQELLAQGRRVGTIVMASNFADAAAENNQFTNSLSTLSLSRPCVAIYIEDPLCFEGLPTGRYRYRSRHHNTQISHATQLRARDKNKLLKLLTEKRNNIIEQFRTGQVTLIDGRIGLHSIKAELQHQGFLP